MTKVQDVGAFLADAEVPIAAERVRRGRLLILVAGSLVVLAVAAAVLFVVVPVVADFFANVFLFITRVLTGK